MNAILLDPTPALRRQLQNQMPDLQLIDALHPNFKNCKTPGDFTRAIKKTQVEEFNGRPGFVLINAHFRTADCKSSWSLMGVDICYDYILDDPCKNLNQPDDAMPVVIFSGFTSEILSLIKPEIRSVFCYPEVEFIQLPYFFDPRFFDRILKQNNLSRKSKKELMSQKWNRVLTEDRHSLANRMGLFIMTQILYDLHNRPVEEFWKMLPYDVKEALSSFKKTIEPEGMKPIKAKAKQLSEGIQRNVATIASNKKCHPTIGLIDDEAINVTLNQEQEKNWGWRGLYESMILGKSGYSSPLVVDILQLPISSTDDRRVDSLLNNFKPGSKSSENAVIIEKLGAVIVHKIIENNCICILLDIKLLGSFEGNHVIQNTGTQLLRYLRKKLPTHPIIITTASNKAYKYEKLKYLKADAIWIKEGLDQKNTTEESLSNYLRFLEIIRTVTGPEYQFLSRLGDQFQRIAKSSSIYWWENTEMKKRKWKSSQKTCEDYYLPPVEKEIILSLLSQIITRVRDHLSRYHLNYSILNKIEDKSARKELLGETSEKIKDIIINCGKIIETIHGKEFNGKYNVTSGTIGGHIKRRENEMDNKKQKEIIIRRGDWIGYALYQLRNESAHAFPLNFTFHQNLKAPTRSLMVYLSHFMSYLSSKKMPFHLGERKLYREANRGKNAILNVSFFHWLLNLDKRKYDLRLQKGHLQLLSFHKRLYEHLYYGAPLPLNIEDTNFSEKGMRKRG